MWQRFTERARRVVLLAQEEAAQLESGFVGSEHLLLGLLREDEGVAAQVLAVEGITYSLVRREVEILADFEPHPGEPKMTLYAKRALEMSAQEADLMSSRSIGTEHLLLGLFHEEGGAAEILRQFALDLKTTRQKVLEYLGSQPEVSQFVAPTLDASTPETEQEQLINQQAARLRELERELAKWRSIAQTINRLVGHGEGSPLKPGTVNKPDREDEKGDSLLPPPSP